MKANYLTKPNLDEYVGFGLKQLDALWLKHYFGEYSLKHGIKQFY